VARDGRPRLSPRHVVGDHGTRLSHTNSSPTNPGWFKADGGLHVTVLLPQGSDDRLVVERLHERGVTATPLSTCFVDTPRQHGLLLGFGTSEPASLLNASRVLGDVLRQVPAAATQRDHKKRSAS
jgi:DNA-binding transcriptional MocR family regulator